jgi:hypothetical protein
MIFLLVLKLEISYNRVSYDIFLKDFWILLEDLFEDYIVAW